MLLAQTVSKIEQPILNTKKCVQLEPTSQIHKKRKKTKKMQRSNEFIKAAHTHAIMRIRIFSCNDTFQTQFKMVPGEPFRSDSLLRHKEWQGLAIGRTKRTCQIINKDYDFRRSDGLWGGWTSVVADMVYGRPLIFSSHRALGAC